MTTITADATDARRTTYRETEHRVTFGGVVKAEWIKLTSVRSVGWVIAIAVVITAGFGALATFATLATAPEGMPIDAVFASMPIAALGPSGLLLSQLVFAVLGVIAITGEYGSGQIRSSFTAVPRRLPVLGAKALVLGLIAFVASLVALAIGMASTIGIAIGFGVDASTIEFDASVAFAVLGGAVYLALLTVFSLGVGALVRSGAAGIAISLGVLLVLPVLMSLVPFAWVQDATPYLLSQGGLVVSMPGLEPGEEFWRSLAVTIAWPAVALGGAAAAIAKRDA